jgi:catechol 2,3-dioxygenase-like lactoylglutathione lyase family enzyme
MKLEVVVVPVSNVDKAKQFYTGLGWREDADFVADEHFHIVQLTPPGSGCSTSSGPEYLGAAFPAVPGTHRRAQPPPCPPPSARMLSRHSTGG